MTLAGPGIPRMGPGRLVFLADVHLDPSFPERTAAFLDLLARLARPPCPSSVLVLGDLFDVWLGKASLRDAAHRPVLEALRGLVRSGPRVVLFQGNRDFLLDRRFVEETGVGLVEERLSMELGGRRTLLCHGDDLLLDDPSHRRLRWFLRSAPARAIAGALPGPALRSAARWLRRKSDSAGVRRGPGGLKLASTAVARAFRGGYDVIIAGHIHEERRRTLLLDGRRRELYTLGAWEERGSMLVFDGGLRFHHLPFGAPAPTPSASPVP